MKIVLIDQNNLHLITRLLNESIKGRQTFRYFEKRPLDVIQNHIATCIMMNEQNLVGYGHLDRDGDDVWLGILVSDSFTGQGIGSKIIDFLFQVAKDNGVSKIKLSVDNDNIFAIKLYVKKGFKLFDMNKSLSIFNIEF
jgi:GNAT superfamily N-acetyltransferase